MVEALALILPYKVLFSHIVFVFIILAFIFKNSWGRNVFEFIGKYAIQLAFLVSIGAVAGSLFYSEILGFEPCVLCWWQRVFLYPLPIILGIALWKRDVLPAQTEYVFTYVIPLTTLAAIIALYQSYTSLGGLSLLPCTAVGGACSKVYVKEFGYITIPLMSLTVSVYVLLIAWIKKTYDKNSNSR